MKLFKTFTPKAETKGAKKWYLVDAADKTLGHISTQVAVVLRGKDRPDFTNHLDMGNYVVVINADKVRLSGKKEDQKEHIRHSGYLGHIKRQPISVVRATHPTRILEQSIAGMIPKNRMKRHILEKLKIYAGSEHPHAGQNLETISI